TLEEDPFKITTCFPKISGYSAQKLQGLTKKVTFNRTVAQGQVEITTEDLERDCVVDISRSFLVCIRRGTFYFDTNAAQETMAQGSGYPEMAVRKIPEGDILGCVTFVRVFHDGTEAGGYTAFPVTSA